VERTARGLQGEGDFQALVERVGKLEKQNRLWKYGSLSFALVAAAALTAGARGQQEHQDALHARTVEAEVFLLKDAGGITRGELTVKDGSPRLQLYSPSGKIVWSTQPRIMTDR